MKFDWRFRMPDKAELYNSKAIKTFIDLIEEKYGNIDMDELLRHSEMDRAEIEDPDVWFTQNQVNKFYYKLMEISGNHDFACEAGRYALEKENKSMGIFKSYLLTLGSPDKIYKISKKFAARIDRSTNYENKILGKNKVEIIATPKAGIVQESFQCENRVGNILQVPELCGCEIGTYEHPECIHNGGDACRYIISWKEPAAVFWGKIRNITIPVFALVCLISIFFVPSLTLKLLLPIVFLAPISLIGWYAEYIGRIKTQFDLENKKNLSELYDQLLNQSTLNYDSSNINKEIGYVVNKRVLT